MVFYNVLKIGIYKCVNINRNKFIIAGAVSKLTEAG